MFIKRIELQEAKSTVDTTIRNIRENGIIK